MGSEVVEVFLSGRAMGNDLGVAAREGYLWTVTNCVGMLGRRLKVLRIRNRHIRLDVSTQLPSGLDMNTKRIQNGD
jgi:hypothetical protein